MLFGVLLGISVSFFLVSGIFLVWGFATGFQQAAFTGAVIGAEGVISYAIIIFILSLIAIVFLFLIFKNSKTIEVLPSSEPVPDFEALPR